MICLAFTDFTLHSLATLEDAGAAAATEQRTVKGLVDLNDKAEVEDGAGTDDTDLGLVEKGGLESGVGAKAIELII